MTIAFDSLPAASRSLSTASGSLSAASGSLSAASLHPFPLSAECVSTADGFSEQSFPMRGDLFQTPAVSFGFYATSRHCIPRLSPRNSNRNAITANNGAAANRSGRGRVSRWLLPADPPRSQRATLRRPSAVSELESLAVARRTPTRRPAKPIALVSSPLV